MLTLDDLTVGDVSGMIAAAINVVHITIILTVPLIVLALIQDKNSAPTASASTWSVVGRSFHSSWWPTLLRADSASSKGVPSSIVTITRLKPFLILLTTVASIITPLGLYQSIAPQSNTSQTSFHYIPDPSDFGLGTVPRDSLAFSRICGAFDPVQCPNSFSNVTYITNATGEYYDVSNYDSHIPQYVIDAFESGLVNMEGSVSSIFDIQSRSYTYSQINDSPNATLPDNGSVYPVGVYRQISTMITENKYVAIEGLIVDMIDGGIGFRNHSAPPVTSYGSSWSEDILFIEPESVCVDLNITIDFMIPQYTSQSVELTNFVLTDRGGFVNLNHTLPPWNFSTNSQNDPELQYRAYRAAWVNNFFSMAFMNITSVHNDSIPGSRAFAYVNSHLGESFTLMYNTSVDSFATTPVASVPNELTTSMSFGFYLNGLDQGIAATNSSFGNNTNDTTPAVPPVYPNPWSITSEDWSSVGSECTIVSGQDLANITNIAAACGIMYGAPRRQDNTTSIRFDPGSNWTIPMYSCISVTKAKIKTVSFQFNGTDDLSSLTITDVQDKVYADNASLPIWGVEQTDAALSDVSPLWGLLSSPIQGNISLSTVQKAFLYLPGYVTDFGFSSVPDYQNMPGIEFHAYAIQAALNIQDSGPGMGDYSGKSSLGMFQLWQKLSQSADTASRILNLIWTDAAANAVVGTKTLQNPQQQGFQKRDDNDNNNNSGNNAPTGSVPGVNFYKRRVMFHWPYGIPAFLALLFTVITLLTTFVVTLIGRSGTGKMRNLLNKTSQGRILTSLVYKSEIQPRQHLYPQEPHKQGAVTDSFVPSEAHVVIDELPTKRWVATVGKTSISLADGSES